jgi:hypothetical protein
MFKWFFSNNSFQLWNISKQSYSKEFSSLNIHSERFIKSLSNWNQSTSHHRAISLSSDSWAINRSFSPPLYLIPSLPLAHLRRATKLPLKIKITATKLYSEEDYFPTIPHYSFFFMTASIGIYHNNPTFHSQNHPIMSGHFFPIKWH